MVWCSELVPDVDVQFTREDAAVIGAVGKISHSMVWCSELVPDVDVQVTREDDAVIGAVGKISHSTVWCSELVPDVDVQFTREDAAVTGAVGASIVVMKGWQGRIMTSKHKLFAYIFPGFMSS